MEFRVLGPLDVSRDGRAVALPEGRARALLVLLLLEAGRVVPVERLVDVLWDGQPPARAVKLVQGFVSRLRRALGPDAIVTLAPGYLVRVEDGALDLARFEALLARARAEPPERATATLDEALALWRGPPLAELAGSLAAEPEVGRVEALHLAAIEERVEAELALGRHERLVPELERLVAREPLRERLRGQLMLALYRSGRQADALAAYQDARRTLVDELGVDPGPELQRLHGSILRHEPELTPAPATPRGALPPQPTPFLGRARELDETVRLLRDPGVRLLTLTGAGGVGKTRLALAAAAAVADAYGDGVWWVPLAPLAAPALVPQAAAQALGLHGDVAAAVGERRLLLVLDNFEHVLAAASRVAELLAACPQLDVLATSREALRLSGEREYVVPVLDEREAVELFRQRASAAAPDDTVLAICRRLDCLPLAVELAAARTKLLPPDQLLARLSRSLPLLTGGPRDAPARQRTLAAAIEWSHVLLDDEERILLARLAVFAGPFTLDAAENVCAARLETLASLVDKSLVRASQGRFSLLQTIREFALDRLEEPGDADAVRRAHAEYFAALGEKLLDATFGGSTEPYVQRVEEQANLRAAYDWAVAAGDADLELALAAAGVVWQESGHTDDARRALERALAQPGGSPRRRAHALGRLASLLAWQPDEHGEAERLAEESLHLYRAAGDVRGRLVGLLRLQVVALAGGDRERVAAIAAEAEELARREREWGLLASFVRNRARERLTDGDLPAAERLLTEALEAHERSGGYFGQRAVLVVNLAEVAVAQGRPAEARSLLETSLALCRDSGLPAAFVAQSGFLDVAAAVALELGEPARAARLAAVSSTWRGPAGTMFRGFEQQLHEETVRRVCAELGAERYEAARAAARSAGLDDALRDALV